MKQLTVRLDDITPDMNWDNFYKIKEILDKYEIKPLLGVVPDNQSKTLHFSEPRQNFFDYMKQLQQEGYVLAQHGYKHVYETKESGLMQVNAFSEFAGLPYEKQLFKLKEGQRILKDAGVVTDIFMAPGHSFDRNTLKALKSLGFKYVTDGFSRKPYKFEGLVFFPCKTTESYHGTGMNTLCVHLNGKSEADIRQFEALIRDNKKWLVDYDCERMEKEARKKGLKVCWQEGTFKKIHRLKNRMAHSTVMADYMILTKSSNPMLKLLKRIVYLPVLVIMILKNGRNKSDE